MRWLILALGVVVTVVVAAAVAGQAMSDVQPWSEELTDNIAFAQALWFAMGLGVAVGIVAGGARAAGRSTRTSGVGADGNGAEAAGATAVPPRRFGRWTIAGHWLMVLGFVLALPTGVWQYLGGILDATLPVSLALIYRIHYLGAGLILFVATWFVTYWWLTGDRSLLPPRGQWRRHLAGFARELPRPLGARLAGLLKLDTANVPPPTSGFTYYETAFSFPTWTIALVIITVTGIIKAMRYVYPVPGPLLFWASTLHVAAMVLLVLKVLDHLRYTLGQWPLMERMGFGGAVGPPSPAGSPRPAGPAAGRADASGADE